MSATSTKCTVSFNSNETNETTPIAYTKEELIALNESLTDEFQSKIEASILDKTYPVGSIYMSTEDDTVEKVENKFGGTWVKYSEGRTLIGAGSNGTSSYTANSTGGSETHNHGGYTGDTALTAKQLPKITGQAIFGANIILNSSTSSVITSTSGVFGATNNSAYARAYSSATGVNNSYTGNHVLTMTFGNNETHNHSISSASNISPYTVLYMYKRTA
jgi:hypothetical protein